MQKPYENVVVVDVETTGTNPQWHGIIEIGAVAFLDAEEGLETETWSMECAPRTAALIDPRALEVNGANADEILSRKVTEYAAVREFVAWLRGLPGRPAAKVLCGVNVGRFDWQFLHAGGRFEDVAGAAAWEAAVSHRVLELSSLGWAARVAGLVEELPEDLGKGMWSSDRLLRAVGLGAEPRPHRAMMGAWMEAQALRRLVGLLRGSERSYTEVTAQRDEACRQLKELGGELEESHVENAHQSHQLAALLRATNGQGAGKDAEGGAA